MKWTERGRNDELYLGLYTEGTFFIGVLKVKVKNQLKNNRKINPEEGENTWKGLGSC